MRSPPLYFDWLDLATTEHGGRARERAALNFAFVVFFFAVDDDGESSCHARRAHLQALGLPAVVVNQSS